MRSIVSLLALSLLCACSSHSTREDVMSGKERLHYPVTRQSDQVDHYFGHAVADPYRWLEDDRSAETEAWVKAQNSVTRDYLARIPFRDAIKDKLAASWNYAKEGAPFREGRYHYFFKNDGLQNQHVLWRQQAGQTRRGVPRSQPLEHRWHHGAGSAEFLPGRPHPGLFLVPGRQRLARDPPDGRGEQTAP